MGVGVMVAMIGFISSILMAASDSSVLAQAAWTFGVATAALGTIKTGIAFILWGIVRRVWMRAESLRYVLPKLIPDVADRKRPAGPISTPYGDAVITDDVPEPLLIHNMATKLWLPMLAMGAMFLVLGLILSFVEAGAIDDTDSYNTWRALVPGIEFFGEALLLGGISFLLGSILASLRQGGGEVQASLGASVKTLKMPMTAKLFIGLMIMGMMISVVQLVFYLFVATESDTATISAWLAWLGPLREAGLGILLAGIVLALATIATVLDFQSARITELIKEGR